MKNTSLLVCMFLFALVFFFASPVTMASEEKSYMVFLHPKPEDVSSEVYQKRVLSKVLGSEAAEKALIYHYSDVVNGFSARLTPEQAEELKKSPEVSSVSASKPLSLFNPDHLI